MRRFVLASIAAASLSASAAAADFTCPEQITPSRSLQAPEGWETFIDPNNAKSVLTRIDLYDGPPKEMALLKPDNADTEEMGPDEWKLGANPRGFYMACVYTGTAIELIKKLPGTFKTCRVVESAEGSVEKLTCN